MHACRQHAGPGAGICGMGDSDVARLVPSGVTAALVALVLVARLACSLLLLLRERECECCIATLSAALCSGTATGSWSPMRCQGAQWRR